MPPDDPDPPEPLAWFEITEAAAAARKWTLSLFADHLRLDGPDDEVHEVDWARRAEDMLTIDHLLLRRVLAVTIGTRKVLFRLDPDAFAAVRAWVGPPTAADLQKTLKQRLGWVTPVGLLFVLSALPLGGMDWEPVSLTFGLGLILTARMAKLWPHRAFFLLVSMWFAFLAVNSVWLLSQEWSWFRAVLLVLQLSLIGGGVREYRRFAPDRMAAEADAPRGDADSGPLP